MPCKQPDPQPVVYTPRIQSASKTVTAQPVRGDAKFRLGDYFCETCGFSAQTLPLPFEHHCDGPNHRIEKVVRIRESACASCPSNQDGVCMEYKARHPDRPASTKYAIENLNIACPKRRFLSHSMPCPECGYLLASKEGVSECHRCGWQGEPLDHSWRWALRDEDLPTPTSDRCVLVIAPDERSLSQLAITGPRIERYAKKCGADYLVLTENHFPDFPLWNKFRASTVAKRYERTLFLDCDILIQGDPPSLFDVVPEDCVGIYDESRDLSVELTRKKAAKIAERYGFGDYIPDGEYNTGVVMLPKEHADAWEPPPEPIPEVWTAEQMWFQFRLARKTAKVFDLGWEWNTAYFAKKFWQRAPEAYFLHAAGSQMPGRLNLLRRLAEANYEVYRTAKIAWPQWEVAK